MTFPAVSASASVLSNLPVVFPPEVIQYISNVICSQQGRIKGTCLNTACGDSHRGGKASLILRNLVMQWDPVADVSQGLNQPSLLPLNAEPSHTLLLNRM